MLLVVCVSLVAALVAVTVTFASLLRSKERAHARREDLLLNQLLHVAGRPWQTAPADLPSRDDLLDGLEEPSVYTTFTASPEMEL